MAHSALSPAAPLSLKALRAKAIALLACREYSREELFRKLSAYAEDVDSLSHMLHALEQEGLLSDQRCADSLARVKGSKFGLARVQYELKNKGIDDAVLEATLDQLRASELDRAMQVIRKRFDPLPTSREDRAKLHRFMAGRGFSAEVISRALSALGQR